MNFSKQTEHFKRYKDLAWLLIKYGRSDIVKQMNMDTSFLEREPLDMSNANAKELPDDLEKLGPTYVKLGQFLSTRAYFLPPEYLEALTRLQDKVEPQDFLDVEKIFTSEIGMRFSKVFRHFDNEPVASASLGQVYAAELLDGTPVAVKVQRPDIREQIFNDLDAFEDIARFLENNTDIGKQLMVYSTLQEFRKSLLNELDYKKEANNLSRLKKNLSDFTSIAIPAPIESYCSTRILTMEYVQGRAINKLSGEGIEGVDGKALGEQLFRSYLHQILIDGFYHADPHPGNIFLSESGKLVLLDLGMVASLSERMQTKLTRLLIAVGQNKGDLAADYALSIGYKTGRANEERFREGIREIVAIFNNSTLQQMEMGRLLLEVTRISGKNGIRLPNELIMLGKALLNLDKAGRILDPEFDPNASLRRNTADIMQKRMRKSFSPGNFYDGLLDAKEFIENLPGRANRIVSTIADNRFTINLKLTNEKHILNEFKEAANRLTLGIILAALIIGAALMMGVETSFTLLGYPGIAIIFFLLAALGGFILIFRILFRDKNKK